MMMEHPDLTVKASNLIAAQAGDMVLVESSSKQILSMAAVVYLLPFALLIAGYLVASALGAAENLSILAGGVCFLASFLISLAMNRSAQRRAVQFSIVQILNRA